VLVFVVKFTCLLKLQRGSLTCVFKVIMQFACEINYNL